MDEIVTCIWSSLKPLGFKKAGHTFNRCTADSLTQVINFQMGVQSIQGKFTLNLGIFVPELYQESLGKPPPKTIKEYDCAIRARISDLLKTEDIWWPLDADQDRTATEITDLVTTQALPFLDSFATREQIIENWPYSSVNLNHSCRPYLDLAVILNHLGRNEEAKAAFHKHAAAEHHPSHVAYCHKLAQKFGWS